MFSYTVVLTVVFVNCTFKRALNSYAFYLRCFLNELVSEPVIMLLSASALKFDLFLSMRAIDR